MQQPVMTIIKTGSAFTEARRRFGDFDDWFRRRLAGHGFGFRTVAVCDGEALPQPERTDGCCGVIVSGSAAMVSHRHDWSERTAAWLAELSRADRLPLLGVCYGHQLLAHALGGQVGPNPNGRRMGTRSIERLEGSDRLLDGIDLQRGVQVTHLEAVLEPPPSARVVARADGDPNHVLHFGGDSWGVQFHPEFDAAIMRCYIGARASVLEGEGIDSGELLDAVTETPAGSEVLARFARLCLQRRKERSSENA